jgi:short-subunit dehydrogenase
MSVVIISRTESKLIEQRDEIMKAHHGVNIRYLAYDFTDMGEARKTFYRELDVLCAELNEDGGVGLLINNVGTANPYPKALDEFPDSEIEDIINCNIWSTVSMTRVVTKYMRMRKSGCVVSVSSGSGDHLGPYLAIYSATK